jgi:Mannosyl-glycoprotein endo-beta-N-acetylglucosaminidase
MVALVAVTVWSAGTAGAQDPTAPSTPSSTASTSVPATPTSSVPSTTTVTEPPANAPVPVPDGAAIDRLVADARAQAVALRNSQIATARAAVEAADARVVEVTTRRDRAAAKATLAAQATKVMQGQVELWRERISAFAADAYMRVGTNQDDALTRIEGGSDRASADRRATIYADKAIAAARRERAAAEKRLAAARDDQDAADAAEATVQDELSTVTALRDSAGSVEQTLRTTPVRVSTDSIVKGLSGPTGPTIMGPSLLGPADLAGFTRTRGGVAPSVDVEALAQAFIDEGNAEGVRGDLAWAQSIIETGNFGFAGSMVHPDDHNYAGIGACDSCSSGFRYDTPQLGARAQIQLLRTYADPEVTAKSLANPPVGKAPEAVGVRGCCSTWMALSGRWATGPGYGIKILTVYNQMLEYAASRRVAAQASPAVPAAPVPAAAPAPVAVPAPAGP